MDLPKHIIEHEILDEFVKNSGDDMSGALKISSSTLTALEIKKGDVIIKAGQKLILNG